MHVNTIDSEHRNKIYLSRKANAACAVNATSHDRLDKRANILVFHGALVLSEATAI